MDAVAIPVARDLSDIVDVDSSAPANHIMLFDSVTDISVGIVAVQGRFSGVSSEPSIYGG